MAISERYDLHTHICWFAESGIHSSNELTDVIKKKLGIHTPYLDAVVQSMFKSFAENRLVCLQIKHLPYDHIIYPIVEPHRLSWFLKLPVTDRGGIKPKIGQKVKFTLWQGNNAPSNLNEWTCDVLSKQRNGSMTEYIVQRHLDNRMIKLTRGFMREYVN